MVANQQTTGYDERFKFTGKERDEETGYDYFGARYYLPDYSIFSTVDPLTDENIELSSYMYCEGNPIKFVDPDGKLARGYLNWAKEGKKPKEASYWEGAFKGWVRHFDDNRLHLWFHGSESGIYKLYYNDLEYLYDVSTQLDAIDQIFTTDPIIGETWINITLDHPEKSGANEVVFHGCYTAQLAEAFAKQYPGVNFTGATLPNNTEVRYYHDDNGSFYANTEVGVYKYINSICRLFGIGKVEGEWRTYYVNPVSHEMQVTIHKENIVPPIAGE